MAKRNCRFEVRLTKDEYYELTSIADRAKMVQQFEQKKKK